MISLMKSGALNTELSKVFSSPQSAILGFDIEGDLEVLSQNLGHLDFYKKIYKHNSIYTSETKRKVGSAKWLSSF